MRKPLRLDWKCDCGTALSMEAFESRRSAGEYEPAADRVICVCDRVFKLRVERDEESHRYMIRVRDCGVPLKSDTTY
jgi:hypothetical protein